MTPRSAPPQRRAGFSSRITATAVRRCSMCRTSWCARARTSLGAGATHGAMDGARRRRVGGGVASTGEPNGDRCVARVAAGPSRGGAVDVGEGGSARSLAELRRDERVRLIEMLVAGELPWTGDEGYRKAEVTGGGVSLAEVDARTMESRRHPGLYICGEVLDAFGPVGGYNFFWAWATGRAAGLGASAERSARDLRQSYLRGALIRSRWPAIGSAVESRRRRARPSTPLPTTSRHHPRPPHPTPLPP